MCGLCGEVVFVVILLLGFGLYREFWVGEVGYSKLRRIKDFRLEFWEYFRSGLMGVVCLLILVRFI